jgi:siroheme synthase-like protein
MINIPMHNSETYNNTNQNRLFPVFLKLEDLNTLIIGGGNVALEKLNAILSNSPAAGITLVAPKIKEEIRILAFNNKNIKIISREYYKDDLQNKDIVIAATGDREVNRRIREEAKKVKLLVNVADTPELCDFYLSSIVQKGSLKLAISTNGKSPTIAKRLKEYLNDAIPGDIEISLNNLVKIRSSLNGNFNNKVKVLNEITSVLVEKQDKSSHLSSVKVFASVITGLLFMALIIYPYTRFPVFEDLIYRLSSFTNSNIIIYVIPVLITGSIAVAYTVYRIVRNKSAVPSAEKKKQINNKDNNIPHFLKVLLSLQDK